MLSSSREKPSFFENIIYRMFSQRPAGGLGIKSSIKSIIKIFKGRYSDFYLFLISLAGFLIIYLPYCFLSHLNQHTRQYFEGYTIYDTLHALYSETKYELWQKVSNITFICFVVLFLVMSLLHADRFIIIRHFLLNLTLIFMIRIALISSTSFPDPSPSCNCYPESQFSMNIFNALSTSFDYYSCNSFILSSSSVVPILISLISFQYYNEIYAISLFLLASIHSLMLVVSRMNYTFDIVVSYVVVFLVFVSLNSFED